MISLVNELPKIHLPRAEVVKINCTYNMYRDIALFWVQDDNRAVVSMLDGNMVIYNNDADIEELTAFIRVISPTSVFSDAKTMASLFENDFHRVCVVTSENKFECDIQSDSIKSDGIYKLLTEKGLELPSYDSFAVDFCYRLNHNGLKYFAINDKCVAIGFCDGQAVLVNGIASKEKGMGTLALAGLLSQYDVTAIAVCEKDVMSFYLKNCFNYSYDAGLWRKNFELF